MELSKVQRVNHGFILTNLPILGQWSIKMGVIFGLQEAMEVVKNGVLESEEGAQGSSQGIYEERLESFLLDPSVCVDSDNFEKISLANSAKTAWDILNKSYGGADKVKKMKLQSFRRQYELLSD